MRSSAAAESWRGERKAKPDEREDFSPLPLPVAEGQEGVSGIPRSASEGLAHCAGIAACAHVLRPDVCANWRTIRWTATGPIAWPEHNLAVLGAEHQSLVESLPNLCVGHTWRPGAERLHQTHS